MDTIVYLRRSVVEDDNPGTVSYEQQLTRCRDIARSHGRDEPDVLVDWGRSGGEGLEHRRSAYQELRERLSTGSVKWIVSYDLSRLSRSTRETLDLIEMARRHGARVHVGDLGILDPDDPVGKFTVTALSGANGLLRDLASRRARDQMAARRAAGLPIGRPQYGGRPGEDVAVILAAFDEAGSYHGAARLLNERGVPTREARGLWAGTVVRRIVARERPIPVTSTERVRSKGRYALTGLLRCHCGARMWVIGRPSGPAAMCALGAKDPRHPRPVQVTEASLLPWIKAEAARLRLPESVTMEIAADEAEAKRIEAREGRVKEAYFEGTINKAEYLAQLDKIKAAREAIAIRSSVVQLPRAIYWEGWDPASINAVLRALFVEIVLDASMTPTSAVWRVPEWRSEVI